jgi:hypothetical protein
VECCKITSFYWSLSVISSLFKEIFLLHRNHIDFFYRFVYCILVSCIYIVLMLLSKRLVFFFFFFKETKQFRKSTNTAIGRRVRSCIDELLAFNNVWSVISHKHRRDRLEEATKLCCTLWREKRNNSDAWFQFSLFWGVNAALTDSYRRFRRVYLFHLQG